jgi:SAM-dependent methyltransferase
MVDYTKADYHEKRHKDLLDDFELQIAWGDFANVAYFSDAKKKYDILEFGSGLGNNLLTVKKYTNVIGIEPSILGRKEAQKNGIECYESLDKLDQNKRFDIILCRHVLEHVENPRATLLSLQEKLKEDGRLILVLPLDKLSQKPKKNDIDHHLFCWNPRTIINLLKASGFKENNYRYEAFNARKKLLPLYKVFGPNIYIKLIRIIGKATNAKELIIESKKNA